MTNPLKSAAEALIAAEKGYRAGDPYLSHAAHLNATGRLLDVGMAFHALATAPRILALLEALEPFAEASARFGPGPWDTTITTVGITVGDLRRARAAYEGEMG